MATVFTLTSATDTFTGTPSDHNVFRFTPATLQSVDTVTGGASNPFIDILEATAGGTVTAGQFAGVAGIEQLQLSSDGNSVALTDGLVGGSAVGFLNVIGWTGNDTIDANGTTNGVTIRFYSGGGNDALTGGAGDDLFSFAAADLSAGDSVAGGTGFDSLEISTPGTLTAAALSGVTGVEAAILHGGVDLGVPEGITDQPVFSIFNYGPNNVVDATAFVTTRTLLYGIAGSDDVLHGGAATDTFRIAAADLEGNDSFDGNGGADQLTITTAGAVTAAALSGISDIEIVELLSGGSVELTDGLSSSGGLYVAGSSAVDTFDGSAVTAFALALDGKGGADTLLGGTGDDIIFAPDSDFAAIDGNGGLDRMVLSTPGQTFDLTANAGKITDLEVISLSQSAGARLVLAATDIPQVNGAANQLYVTGGSDDEADIGSGWVVVSTMHTNAAVAPGVTFVQFHSAATDSDLFISDQIAFLVAPAAPFAGEEFVEAADIAAPLPKAWHDPFDWMV